jgi:putative ABC transport system permease protein
VLWESTLLGFLGGLFGLCIGYLMMKVLLTSTNLQGLMKMEYDFVFMVKAMIISVLLGFLSGIYPAVKAISIEPIKVLRYE